jgi:integrase
VEKVLSLAPKEYRDYLITLIHTAGRMREINKLKWEDVDFNEDYLVLRTRKAKNSDVAERKAPLTRTLKAILEGLPCKGEYVFSHQNGKRYDNRIKYIRSLCKQAKVKQFTFHNLRHFSASKLANLGVAITDIQEILGHTTARTTSVYLQSIKGSVRSAINKLEENPPPNPPPEE